MAKENLVGLARVVLYRRERILMLQPRGKGLMATALRYRNEVRDEDNYFSEIPSTKVPSDMLDLAIHILESKKAHFEPEQFEDRYENALTALIQAKQAGKPLPEGRRSQAEQRHQPDGCAAAQREGRKGRRQGRQGRQEHAARAPARRASPARKRTTQTRTRVKRAS